MTERAEVPDHWIGLASELLVAPAEVTTRRAGSAIAVHHPKRRNFHDLNALWPISAPSPEGLPELFQTWDREFGGTGVEAQILCWEENGVEEEGGSPWAQGDTHGDFRLSRLEVLRCTEPAEPRESPEFSVRRVEGDEDWEAVVELNLACHGFTEGAEADFCRWMIGSRHRECCESGRASWWAAWEGMRPIAAAGVYGGADGGPARFQEVVTHRDHRRRGACTTLLSQVLAAGAAGGFLLIADQGSDANRIYRRLGFEPVSRIRELFKRLPA